MVEHQAEVVRWLTRRCHNLQREVLRLSLARETCGHLACLLILITLAQTRPLPEGLSALWLSMQSRCREEEGSGGSRGAAREDLEHRLAARERECAAPSCPVAQSQDVCHSWRLREQVCKQVARPGCRERRSTSASACRLAVFG